MHRAISENIPTTLSILELAKNCIKIAICEAMKRKHLIPFLILFSFCAMLISIALPFLPFGSFFFVITLLLILPYFSPAERLLKWILCRDRTGIVKRACKTTAALYAWAEDHDAVTRIEHTLSSLTVVSSKINEPAEPETQMEEKVAEGSVLSMQKEREEPETINEMCA